MQVNSLARKTNGFRSQRELPVSWNRARNDGRAWKESVGKALASQSILTKVGTTLGTISQGDIAEEQVTSGGQYIFQVHTTTKGSWPLRAPLS